MNLTNSSGSLSTGLSDNCTYLSQQEGLLLYSAKFWLEGVTQVILAVLGVITNLISIYVLSRKELRNTFNQLLIILAIFDILYLCLVFIDSIGQVFHSYLYNDTPDWYKILTPHLLYPGKAIVLTSSIFMMISIAVERFTAVFYPFSRIPIPTTLYKPCFKKKRLFVYIFPVIFFSILLNIFKFLETDVEWLEERAKLNITQLRVDSLYILVNGWVRLIFLGLLPLTIIISLNCCIYWAVRRARLERLGRAGQSNSRYRGLPTTEIELRELTQSQRPGQETSRQDSLRKDKKRIISAREQRLSLVLIMIALIFILSSLPRIIIMMYDLIIIDTIRSCIAAGHMGEGFPMWNHILGYVNHVLLSAVPTANFLVYCLVGNKFRRIADIYLRRALHLSPVTRRTFQPRPGSLRSSVKTTGTAVGGSSPPDV